jgi:hypothetical protein
MEGAFSEHSVSVKNLPFSFVNLRNLLDVTETLISVSALDGSSRKKSKAKSV